MSDMIERESVATATVSQPQREDRKISFVEESAIRDAEALRQAANVYRSNLLPDHLRMVNVNGKWEDLDPEQVKANCFLVASRALMWEVDLLSCAAETYVVGGKLAFQGKLILFVVNRKLKKRLRPTYSGEGDDRKIVLRGTLHGEDEPRESDLTVRQGKTVNEMWVKDPDQKLLYTCATKWTRAHMPDVLFGAVGEGEEPPTVEATSFTPLPPVGPRLESSAAKVSDYDRLQLKIELATSRHELVELKSRINAQDTLTDDERESLIEFGRERYAELSPQKQQPQTDVENAEPDHVEKESHEKAEERWFRTISTEVDANKLPDLVDVIQNDKNVLEDAKQRLLAIISGRVDKANAKAKK